MSSWFRVYGFADIQDGFLVGAYPLDREDVGMLEAMKIERILNLVEDDEYQPGERADVETALVAAGIEEHRLGLTDYGRLPAPDLERAVAEVVAWLDDGRRVYVHCRAGWQRSAAVAAGVVALREGIGIEDALARVRVRKPSADPLPQQREDLIAWWSARGGGENGAGGPEDGDGIEGGEGEPRAGAAADAMDVPSWAPGVRQEVDPSAESTDARPNGDAPASADADARAGETDQQRSGSEQGAAPGGAPGRTAKRMRRRRR